MKHKNNQNKPIFNEVYTRTNSPKIKDGAYLINLHDYKSIGTHWKTACVNGDNVTYLDSFGVEYIPKEIKKLMGNKNNITNIYRIQAYNAIKIW